MSEDIAPNADNTSDMGSSEQPNDGDMPKATGNTSPATKQKFKYKVDNEEIEEELSSDELANYLSKVKGADKRFREAASLRGEVEQFVRDLKQNPMPYLSKLGIDLKSLIQDEHISPEQAERILMRQLEEASLTPEQKELRDLKREKEAREKEELTAKEKREQEQQQVDRQAAAEAVQDEILGVLQQVGMKPTPRLILQVAQTMLQVAQSGKRLSPQQALMQSRKGAFEDAMEMFNAINDDQLLKALPPEFVQRLNKALLGNSAQQQPKKEQPKQQSKKRQYRTLDELLGD